MVGDSPHRNILGKSHCHEVFRGDPVEFKTLVLGKAKTPIKGLRSYHHASVGASVFKPI